MNKIPTSVLDLFAGLVGALVVLFALALVLINAEQEVVETMENKADFLILVTWDKAESDIDIWTKRTSGGVESFCGYSSREVDHLLLRNDHTNMQYLKISGQDTAEEIMEIRGGSNSTYECSLHGFSIRSGKVTCKLELHQVNPHKILLSKEVVIESTGEELTVFSLELDSKDKVVNLIKEEDLLFRILLGVGR